MNREILRLSLEFPHGISSKVAQKIARDAQMIVQAGISEGGMEILGTTDDGEGLIFSETSMQYVYGHETKAKK